MTRERDKVRVLLVEDDEDDYLITRDLLAEIDPDGYELEWAATYQAAQEVMAHDGHDVCLLDYRLGARTGLELLHEARARDYRAPIILLTGQEERAVDLEAMQAGAADYLVKGRLSADLLERSIRYSIAHRRNEQERIQLVLEQEARVQAEEANRAKDEFLALVSHELRTPLTAILGWAGMLAKAGGDARMISQATEIIERNAHTQKQLIEDLLDLARVASGQFRLEVRPVELVPVISAAIDGIRPTAEAKGIGLSANLDPATGQVMGDPDRLQQVVWNLLSNAIKFTPSGGRVEVRWRMADGGWRNGEPSAQQSAIRHPPSAILTVSDTGAGISADFLPYVFERFRQADAAGGRQGGLGLGLALVRHLVEAHGGTVEAASEGKNSGATFTVMLPIRALKA